MPSADVGATRARLIASIAERLRQLGGPAGRLARAGIVGLVPVLAGGGGLAAAEPTRSSYIADVQIDQGTIKKFADESDNFHLTWHPNGSLYGAYGDGWGFVPTDVTKRAIGVSRINGTPPKLTGAETWEGAAQGGSCCWSSWNGKSWGMIAVGAKLHMWFTIGRPRALGFTEARIATSSDNGATWSKANWAFTPGDKMLMPTFMQVGQGYQSSQLPAEIMNYVYSFHTQYVTHPSHVQSPGRVLLMRAPKGAVQTRSSYEFFAGTTASGAPIWTTELGKRQPVLEKPNLLDVAPAVAWNPHLQRFIMVMGHVPAGATAKRGVGFYEAEKPWGPWYRIKEIDQFTEGTIFFYQLPTKWMYADLSAWMAFTGPDKEGGQEWDALDVVKVKFVLADPGTAPSAANDTATTDAGRPVTIAVLANDKGTGLTIPDVTTPANGTARINTDRTITYTPRCRLFGQRQLPLHDQGWRRPHRQCHGDRDGQGGARPDAGVSGVLQGCEWRAI